MCENLHYESVYFKQLHPTTILLTDNVQSGGAVVSTITSWYKYYARGNARWFKSFQNSSHIIYWRLITDSAKAVKTEMRP